MRIRTFPSCWVALLVAASFGSTSLAFRAEDTKGTDALRAPKMKLPEPGLKADQRDATEAAGKVGIKVRWNARLGTPFSVRGKALGERHGFSGGKGLTVHAAKTVEENALAVLDNLSRFYGFKDVEREFLTTKLFDPAFTDGKRVILIAENHDVIDEYLALKRRKERAVAENTFEEIEEEIAWSFGRLLGYSDEAIRMLMSRQAERRRGE